MEEWVKIFTQLVDREPEGIDSLYAFSAACGSVGACCGVICSLLPQAILLAQLREWGMWMSKKS